jgi:D-alanine transaminase/branched-chain amino acid aminotransferase
MPAFFNNRFITNGEAVLHSSDLSIQRGYGVFDFLRTVNTHPLFLQHHLDRFFYSAQNMHLQPEHNKEELTNIIHQLIEQAQLKEAGIRLLLTGGYSPDTYHISKPNLLITCNPVTTSTTEMFQKGLSIITYEHQRELPHIKSINYLMAVWLHPLLKEKKADDVLYYQNNIITEFPRANVFAVINNVLVTPASNMLKGITRKFILEQAASFIPTEERDIHPGELYHASEIFLTSTTKRVMPVLKLNDDIVGTGTPGPVAAALWDLFMKMEQQL